MVLVSGVFLFALLALASFRIWRLLGRDDITAFARQPLPEIVLKGLTCPWCLGSWLAFAAVFVVDRWFVPLTLPVLWGLGTAAVVGFLGEIDAKLDD